MNITSMKASEFRYLSEHLYQRGINVAFSIITDKDGNRIIELTQD